MSTLFAQTDAQSGFVLPALRRPSRDHAGHHLLRLAAYQVDTSAFFTAGRGICGPANGFAIAGDYMSAASFLGIAGLIYLYGFDGFVYSVGFLVAFLTVLFLLAERMRNSGKYTIADVLSFRMRERPGAPGRGHRHADRGRLLPDRPDGRRGGADPEPAPASRSPTRWSHRRADAGLRDLRRHDRHHLRADREGGPAHGGRHRHVGLRARAAWASTRSSCSARRPRRRGRQRVLPVPGPRQHGARGHDLREPGRLRVARARAWCSARPGCPTS